MSNPAITRFVQLCQAAQLTIDTPPKSRRSDEDTVRIQNYLSDLNQAIDTQIVAYGSDAVHHIETLIAIRTLAIDIILMDLFKLSEFSSDFALFAVGGYGRGELLPASDIDMLLIGKQPDAAKAQIESFVAKLWDIGITPAFSVRSLDETRQAVTDQTIASAMLDARILAGDPLLADFPYQTVKQFWDAKSFYAAKMAESKARYLAHNATEYNLEPNIKNAPGGLRDLHMIGWLGRFYFGYSDLTSLTKTDFINEEEFYALTQARRFLWCIRHHLHTLAGRSEERLLFDHQKSIAQRFGYFSHTDHTTHRDVTAALEAMMRVYYRHAMKVAAFSEMLCEYFYENYLATTVRMVDIDADFCLVQSDADITGEGERPVKITIRRADVFEQNPSNLLKIFLIMGRQGIRQITASTLRAICLSSDLIDENYRANSEHQRLFLMNLQEQNYLFHRLRLMKRFGVLGNYLPAFGKIMGLMQYDLFHRYTVDAHTLLLVRILHRFSDETRANDFGLVGEVYQKITRKDILVIAAIFHDIAKGRGGDHSKLGAKDAYEFCLMHGMSETDAEFVRWLVLEHLAMSLIAQKQDITDPEVIARFAEFTGNITRLNHLYVLTVADMNATNSQLWNTWRAALLKQLYVSVHRVHSLGTHITNKDIVIENRKNKAQDLLPMVNDQRLQKLWSSFGEEYFLKQKHQDIAWQSAEILAAEYKLKQGEPIIAFREHKDVSLRGMQLLICTPDQDNLFATTVCILDQLGLSVLDATILSATIDGVSTAVDSYVLIDQMITSNQASLLGSPERVHAMMNQLTKGLQHGSICPPVKTFDSEGKLKHFTVPTQVYFSAATSLAHQGHQQMHLITKDRPSLLAKVGAVFSRLNIQVHGARITTLGERAEDVFYLSGVDGKPLSDVMLDTLKCAIIEALS